jgi:hypothetical protein
MYWMMNIPSMFASLGAHAVGSCTVKRSDQEEEGEEGEEGEGQPVIDARGIVFPVLAQEMSKGVAELLSHWGLADLDDPTTATVLKHGDDIRHEPYLEQIGPEMWRRFLKVKPRNIPLIDLYAALSKQEPDELHKIMAAVVDDPENAKEMLSDLVAQPDEFEIDQWTPESEFEDRGEEDEEGEDREDWR